MVFNCHMARKPEASKCHNSDLTLLSYREQHHALWKIIEEPANHVNSDYSAQLQASEKTEPDAAVAASSGQGGETAAESAARVAASLTRILVAGAPGSGKSICLAATVEALRKRGWCVAQCFFFQN